MGGGVIKKMERMLRERKRQRNSTGTVGEKLIECEGAKKEIQK